MRQLDFSKINLKGLGERNLVSWVRGVVVRFSRQVLVQGFGLGTILLVPIDFHGLVLYLLLPFLSCHGCYCCPENTRALVW